MPFLKKRFIIKLTLLSIIQLLSITFLFGQEKKITIIDSKSKEPIPFAHVCFEELNGSKKEYSVSDKDGLVKNAFTKPFAIAISYVGYKNYLDTLQPNKNYEIELIPQVFDLDQVVVTASFTPQKADKSIYNVKVIDSRKIELKAANNLADILKDEVNFQVTNDPSLGSTLKIKGLSGNNIKILIDGVPVIGRMGGNIDLSQLNLYNVDHIEIVEGPMSVVYGSNALAGAINIITKENLHSAYNVSANSYYETKGTYNFDGMVAFQKGHHNYSLAGGRKFFSGLYLESDTNRSQTWKPKEQYNSDFAYSYRLEKTKIKYQNSFMYERLYNKGDQTGPDFSSATDNWFRSLRFTNRLEYNHYFKNNTFLNIWGSHTLYSREKLSYMRDFIESTNTLLKNGTANDTSKSNAVIIKLLYGNQDIDKKINFLTGFDYNFENAIGKRIINTKQALSEYALFGYLIYNASSKVSLQPGFRFSYYSIGQKVPVPAFNIKWTPTNALNIRGSYSKGFRAPTLKELYFQFVDVNHNINPNDSLKPESGHNYDLSVSINTDKRSKIHFTNVELSIFYKQLKDHIYLAQRLITTPQGTFSEYNYINISYFNTLGGQLAFKYSFYPNFDFGLGYGITGVFASLYNQNGDLKKYKFNTDASLNASYNFQTIKTKIYINYKYTGVKWDPDLSSSSTTSISEGIIWGKVEEFHNIDFSVLKKFFSNKIGLTIGIKNLLNNTTIKRTGQSGDTPHSGGDGSAVGYGRFFFTSISYNFSK